MNIVDIILDEGKSNAWGKSGNKLVRKYRCTFGPRKGRVMSSPAACNRPINLRKSTSLKKTKASKAGSIKAKTSITKRTNPVSRRLRVVNKPKSRTGKRRIK